MSIRFMHITLSILCTPLRKSRDYHFGFWCFFEVTSVVPRDHCYLNYRLQTSVNKGFHKIGCGQQGVDIAALLYNNLLEVSILNTFDTQNYLLLTLQFRFYMKPFHHLCNKTRFTGMADLSLLFYQLGTIIVLLLNSISIRLGYTGLYYC